jgi:hypothetical protein
MQPNTQSIMAIDWKELVTTSHLETVKAIQRELEKGHIDEVEEGLSLLMQSMSKQEKRAVRSQLIRLMKHIIKWKSQPEKRSTSWVASIVNARHEIEEEKEFEPSITDDYIRSVWEKCLSKAIVEAEADMNKKSAIRELSWDEVFNDDYSLMQ